MWRGGGGGGGGGGRVVVVGMVGVVAAMHPRLMLPITLVPRA